MNSARIVFFITDLDAGGAERALCRLLPGLQSPQKLLVISLKPAGRFAKALQAAGIQVVSPEMHGYLFNPLKLFRCLRQVAAFQAEIFQGWMYHGNLAALLFKLLLISKASLSWAVRQSLTDLKNEKAGTALIIRVSAWLSRYASRIVYNSDKAASQHELLGFVSDRAVVIPNGVDLQEFSFSEAARINLRSQLKIDSQALVLGLAARYHPMKNQAALFSAMASLPPGTAITLLVAGELYSAEVQKELLDQLPESRRAQVHFLGYHENMAEFYSACDLLLLVSAWGESFPNVIAEAMACERPCLAPDLGDLQKIIGDTGFCFTAGKQVELEEILQMCCVLSEHERTQLGRKARLQISSNYSLEKFRSAWQHLFQELRSEH